MEFKHFFFCVFSCCYLFFSNSSFPSFVFANPRLPSFCPTTGNGVRAILGSPSGSVEGTVEVIEGGNVNVNLTASVLSLQRGEECLKSSDGKLVGLKYHIHSLWNQDDINKKWGSGKDECSAMKTGGHWDPTLACSPLSANEICKSKGIEASSSGGEDGNGTNNVYLCNPSVYVFNAFSCEVGDLSGKFGSLMMNSISSNEITGQDQYTDVFLSNWCLLVNKSVVFHCQDGERTLCAKFEKFESAYGNGEKKEKWSAFLISTLLFVVLLIYP